MEKPLAPRMGVTALGKLSLFGCGSFFNRMFWCSLRFDTSELVDSFVLDQYVIRKKLFNLFSATSVTAMSHCKRKKNELSIKFYRKIDNLYIVPAALLNHG
jgi:hypothetical protein